VTDINFPCETALIFNNTIFNVNFYAASGIHDQMATAIIFFKKHFKPTEKQIKESLRVSFWGAYLNYQQTMELK
jgi:hypothetical protein